MKILGIIALVGLVVFVIAKAWSNRRKRWTCQRCGHYPLEGTMTDASHDDVHFRGPKCPECGWAEGDDPSMEAMLRTLFPIQGAGQRPTPEEAIRVLTAIGDSPHDPVDFLDEVARLLRNPDCGIVLNLARLFLWTRPTVDADDFPEYTYGGDQGRRFTFPMLQEVDLAELETPITSGWVSIGPLLAGAFAELLKTVVVLPIILSFYSVHEPYGVEEEAVVSTLGLVQSDHGFRQITPGDLMTSMEVS